jgi:peptidoglycan/LPS O-acetylase OafA/YrhL
MSEARSPPGNPIHIVTVDLARGVLALAVLAYHYLHLEDVAHVERVAYYAVYAFFTVSGFALFLRYRDGLDNADDIRRYVARRFFRIAPLFYFALILHVWLVGPEAAQGYKLIWSASLLFGFANPGASSLLMGGWSIGIEMVFYLVLPFLIWTLRSVRALLIAAVVAVIFSAAFVNFTLEGHQFFDAALWSAYTQPAAFIGYFMAGGLLAALFQRYPAKALAWPALVMLASLAPFLLIYTEHPIELLLGWRGLALTAATIAFVCAAVYLREPTGYAREAAKIVGALSYPIYLLHPLAYLAVEKLGVVSTWPKLAAATTMTILLSLVVWRVLEVPAREFGRRVFP